MCLCKVGSFVDHASHEQQGAGEKILAICAGKNKAKLFYPSYVRTYLEKDVRGLLKIKDQMLFMKFMRLCAARVGSLFNAQEVDNEVGVDGKTITHWLSVLHASYLVTLLPRYYENIPKRLVKTPKLYFNAPELACYLLDIESPEQLDRDKMRGAIFENFVVMEAVKHRYNQGLEGGVFFYRDSNQNEVDVLLKQEGEITAIEVKSSMTYSKSFEKSLSQFDKWIQTPLVRKVVVYTGEFENTAGDIKTSLVISCYKDIILHLGMEWGRGMFKLRVKRSISTIINIYSA